MIHISIGPMEGFDNQVGHLVSIMDLARQVTRNVVSGLDTRQLDFEHDSDANSIASLLMHMGAMELFVIRNMFRHRDLREEEFRKWSPALSEKLPLKLIKGNSLDYYLSSLQEVRNETLDLLKNVKDEWLYREHPMNERIMVSNYYRLFHLAEDEVSHTGQIKYIKKRIPAAKISV